MTLFQGFGVFSSAKTSIVTGGDVTESGGFRYHTFTSSNLLDVVSGPVPADILIISGGGGAGGDRSGGGGGGGVRLVSAMLSEGKHAISVGAGGAGGVPGSTNGSSGSSSYIRYDITYNEILNGSFENNIDHWTTYNGHSVSHATTIGFVGTKSLQVNATSTSLVDIYETVTRTNFVAGDSFTFSAYARGGTANRGVYVFARCFASDNAVTGEFAGNTVTPNTSTWLRTSTTFQIPANTARIGMNIQFSGTGTGTTFIDGVMLEKGTTLSDYVEPDTGTESAVGGGKGGSWMEVGSSGGSGGGGGGSDTTAPTGGAGTSGQGFNGGNALQRNGTTWYSVAGGGGGAGAAGSNGSTNSLGQGGVGTNVYSAWATATSTGQSGRYSGGGTGGADIRSAGSPDSLAGGVGGGGTGSKSNNGGAGAINTGGGGGGGGITFNPTVLKTGGAGGSGLVIVRYPI